MELNLQIQPKVGFLLTPQSSQYIGMGKVLYSKFPIFKTWMNIMEDTFKKLSSGISLLSQIWFDEAHLNDVDICGCGIYAIQISLWKLLKEFGVEPDAVLGFSLGEHSSAVIAGILTPEDGLKFLYERSMLVKEKVEQGAIFLISSIQFNELKKLVQQFNQSNKNEGLNIDICGIQGEQLSSIGGTFSSLHKFEQLCITKDIEYLKLKHSTPYAFHTSTMDIILQDLIKFSNKLTYYPLGHTKFISCFLGRIVTESDLDETFLPKVSRYPVRFSEAIQHIFQPNTILIEIGPTPKIIQMLPMNFKNATCIPKVKASLEMDQNDEESIFNLLVWLSLNGVKINWDPWFKRLTNVEQPLQILKFSSNLDNSVEDEYVEVEINAISLNYVDKQFAENFDEHKIKIGYDLSGIVTRIGSKVHNFSKGDSVYGICIHGSTSSFQKLKIHKNHLALKPKWLNFEEACTIPLSYLIAWKALVIYGEISSTDKVLVNFSKGWIGIVLAQIVSFYAGEIYALLQMNDEYFERKEILLKLGVPENRIYKLNDTFPQKIMEDTNWKGLTIVVNNFTDSELKEKCLSLFGKQEDMNWKHKFLDISYASNWDYSYFKSKGLKIHYETVKLLEDTSMEDIGKIWKKITDEIQLKKFTPIPNISFPIEIIDEIFYKFLENENRYFKPVLFKYSH